MPEGARTPLFFCTRSSPRLELLDRMVTYRPRDRWHRPYSDLSANAISDPLLADNNFRPGCRLPGNVRQCPSAAGIVRIAKPWQMPLPRRRDGVVLWGIHNPEKVGKHHW